MYIVMACVYSYGRRRARAGARRAPVPVAIDLVMAYLVMADGSYGLRSYPSLST